MSKSDVLDALDDTVPFVSKGVRTAAAARGVTGRSSRAILEDLWARMVLGRDIGADPVDEQEIADRVAARLEPLLTQVQPEQLADAVVAALPVGQAQQVADLVLARLAAAAQAAGEALGNSVAS